MRIRILGGQVYEPAGERLWRSRCAECGAWFTIETGKPIATFAPSRRCALHGRPGALVAKLRVEVETDSLLD